MLQAFGLRNSESSSQNSVVEIEFPRPFPLPRFSVQGSEARFWILNSGYWIPQAKGLPKIDNY